MTAWRPVLEGALAERAEAAIARVASDLARLDPRSRSFGASVAGGAGGFAVLFAELAARGEPGAADLARAHVDAAVEAVAAEAMPPSLYAGFLSVAWVMSLLEGTVLDPPDEPPAEELEEVLLRFLGRSPWPFEYDLIAGLVGFGLYALRRRDTEFGRDALAAIVSRLEETAVRGPGTAAWFTSPGMLPEHQRVEFPDGYFNGGLAHGIPGVVGLLGQVAGTTGNAAAGELMDGALAWLEAHRLSDTTASIYPSLVDPGGGGRPSRLAWCYGDPGISSALLVAARALGREDVATAAVNTLRASAERPHELSGVVDAGLCHGAAGVAHIYNRFFQATGDELFLREARHWFADALDRAVDPDDLGGFQSWAPGGLAPDPGLLSGSAGVALALLAATGDRAPAWDQLLMLSPA